MAVGTTLQRAAGGPGVTATQTAANVTVQHGATIAANARKTGNGGRVAVLSAGTTTLNGTITAKGGAQSGNGGLVETSGNTLALGSSLLVDTSAPNGLTGSWLMDPANVTVGTLAGDMTPGTIVTDLVSSNLTIAADNDITVNNAIDATTNAGATNSLIFEAGRSIAVNANITLNGGSFVATANDSADLGTGLTDRSAGAGAFTSSGAIIDTHIGNQGVTIAVGGSVTNSSTGPNFVPGTITLGALATGNGGAVVSGGTLLTLTGNIAAGTGLVSLGSTGGISQSGGSITAAGLGLKAAGAVILTQANAVGTLAAQVSGSGNGLQFSDAATALTIGNTGGVDGIQTANGGVSLATTTSGNISVGRQILTNGGEVDIAVAPGGTFTATDQINATGGGNSNGNIVIVADAMSVSGSGLLNAGPANTGATVVLTPATKSEAIALGTVSSTGTLGLSTTLLNNAVQGGMLQIGDPSVSGNINIAAALNPNANQYRALLLVAGASGGTVTQTTGQALNYNNGTLGVFAAGAVTLTEPTNRVGAFTGLSSGGNVSYVNSNALAVGALPLQQLAVTVSGTTGLAISSAYTLSTQSGPLAGVTAAGSGAVFLTTKSQSLTLNDPLNGGTVDLTLAAGVTQGTAGTIGAGTLQSSGGVTGTVTLTGTLNTIAALGSIAITNGNFSLADTGSLSVAGPLDGRHQRGADRRHDRRGRQHRRHRHAVAGRRRGGLALNSGHVLSGTVVDLSASGGGVTQTGGSIVAGTLQSSSGVANGASLTSITNQVTNIGSFAVSSGNFVLKNSTPLTVASTLSATAGNVSLETSTGTISVGAAGTVMVPATTGVASFRAASMSVISGGTITGGTFEYSLDTAGALTLGTGGELTSLAGIGTGNVRLGEVGGSITANSINIASAFGSSGTALELDSNGAISQTAGATLTASTLTGSAAVTTNGDADFNVSNAIGTLGNFVVGGASSSGNFILFNAGSIAVPGSVSAATVTIDAGTIGLSGSLVTPNTGTIDLVSTAGGIALTGSAVLNTGTVSLESATSISEASTATIDAASFSAAASAGAIGLVGTANAIDLVTGLVAIRRRRDAGGGSRTWR